MLWEKPIKDMEEENIESQLWDRIASLQGSVFRTSGRNGSWCGEMFVSTKEKSITRATVMKAYWKAVELGGVVPGPKKLGTFGASCLYSIFQRLGVIKDIN